MERKIVKKKKHGIKIMKHKVLDKKRNWIGVIVSVDYISKIISYDYGGQLWFIGWEDAELLWNKK